MMHNLPSPKTNRKGKIVGRGQGSGKGAHTTGRGMKGQKSRSGYTKPTRDFEGGQNPLSKRLPKLRGEAKGPSPKYFQSRQKTQIIKLSDIQAVFDEGSVVTIESLLEKGLVKPVSHKLNIVKVLFDTDMDKKIDFEGVQLSQSAQESVEKKGGKVN